MGLFNWDGKKAEEPRKVKVTRERSRTTEKRNGDVVTDTFFEEIEFEGTSEECKSLAANIYVAGRQAEQHLLPEQPENPSKRIRPMRVVNE